MFVNAYTSTLYILYLRYIYIHMMYMCIVSQLCGSMIL